MIARLGDQLQHHFSHEVLTDCTPDAVALAALRRWIVLQLNQALIAQSPIDVTWQCPFCDQKHTANLIANVSRVAEAQSIDGHSVDAALLNAEGKLLAAIFVRDESQNVPTAETLAHFRDQAIFVMTIPVTATAFDAYFSSLIPQGHVHGGPCPVWIEARSIIRDPETIKKVLCESVSTAVPSFLGPVETIKGLSGLLKVGDRLLWLPRARWHEIIGGMHNPLSENVEVLIQEWPQSDGSTLYLLYVTVRNESAVGIRRYAPGIHPIHRIDERFRRRQTTALDIVRYMVSH